MNVQPIKSYLRHVALLAKEYRENITPSEADEAKHLQQLVDRGGTVAVYDKLFLDTVRGIKLSTHKQLEYFAKKMLDEFAVEGKEVMDIDTKKVELARKLLSSQEMSLLRFLFELIVAEQKLGKDKGKKYREVDFSEIEPALDRFVDSVPEGVS
jgi:hypothetical protein